MHAGLLNQLQGITNQAMQRPAGQGRVDAFLGPLGPVHEAWHSTPTSQRKLGFLLFHWHVVQQLKTVGGPASLGGITPFTRAQFRQFGWRYNVTASVRRGRIDELETFSQDVENWHNRAHMAIGMAFGVDLMNPRTNITLKQFWQLHFFINNEFEKKLKTFRRTAGQNAVAVVADVEKRNHSMVPDI